MESIDGYKPSRRKAGSVEYFGTKIDYTYRTQDVLTKSPIFRLDLAKWDEKNGGLIGVLFEDNEIAWSNEVPRHTALIKSEGKDVEARIQTTLEPWSVVPVVQIDALSIDTASKIIGFMKRSSVKPTTQIIIRTTDRLDGSPQARSETIFSGKISNYNPLEKKPD